MKSVRRPLPVALSRLGRDRTRGARALSREALTMIADAVRRGEGDALSSRELSATASALRLAQPAMGTFQRWADDLARLGRAPTAGDRRRALVRWLTHERGLLERELPRIAATAKSRLAPRARVVTLSRSQTVLAALTGLPPRRRPSEVVVLESRPGGEGRRFATDLKESGLPARWVHDGRRAAAVQEADVVVIGADTILRDGSILHKVGTRTLAQLAHRAGVPVYVVAGRTKALDRTGPARLQAPLFDRTPARWITEFWTEDGAVPAARWRGTPAFKDRSASRRSGGAAALRGRRESPARHRSGG